MSRRVVAASNPLDVSPALEKTHMSPQDEYFKYQLLKEKLEGKADLFLKAQSEQDQVMIKILNKISQVGESTPEFSQLVEMTGTRNRMLQAEKLAALVYEKEKAEKILSFYAPSASEVEKVFTLTNTNATNLRSGGGGAAGAVGASTEAPAPKAFKAATGGGR
jgi:hypothetical protein